MEGNEKAQHNREAFQIERVILFTDAVFAIAMTLLVIEIKVPELHHPREIDVVNVLLRLIPKFVGFFLSFFIIAIYWTAHHRIFRFVRRLDNKLIWLNLVFLLSIILMPFTTAYQSEYTMMRTPWIVYSVNVAFTGIMQTLMQHHLRNPSLHLVAHPEHEHADLDLSRPLMSPIIFGASIILAFFLPAVALRAIPAIGFPLLAIWVNRRYKRIDESYREKHGPHVLA